MNIVIWARVSSREQKEGYSIDAQLRSMRDKAAKLGWTIVREFVVAESAKRGADRKAFNDMLRWIKKNAKRKKIDAIFAHKLDRVCRNMPDAVRLQALEDDHGVTLAFVENDFGPGAAGALSFNVMAAVAQYYSDNLRSEVIKGMDEKVRQGWPTGLAPFGYINVKGNREEPVQPHPEASKTLIRIFELYSRGNQTFESLAVQLAREGHIHRKSQPRFNRTTLSHILNNRFYIGELARNGRTYQGKYRLLIDRRTFERCQDILHGRNRRTGNPTHAFAGGLFQCVYCGRAITGERVRRKLADGSVREHLYYRCANNTPNADHPRVRWRAEILEEAIYDDLLKMRMPPEVAPWFREAITSAFTEAIGFTTRQKATLAKRLTELKNKQDRLLDVYLAGDIDEGAYQSKSAQFKQDIALAEESLAKHEATTLADSQAALRIFEWTQNAAQVWRGSNNGVKREILETVCLNRQLGDVSLYIPKSKPFEFFIEGLKINNSRGEWI